MTGLSPEMSLQEAKDWLRVRVDDGAKCPCCTQFAKLYRRKINSTMARALILIYRNGGGSRFVHIPSLRAVLAPHHSNEEPKLRYWDLLEEEQTVRPDGGRAGWWRVTDLGARWVLGAATVPKYARIYDGRCLRVEGDQVTIRDALGDRFDYRELMGGDMQEAA